MLFPFHRRSRCRGRLCRAALASALVVAGGCEGWRTVKVDHPVLGPPPPRLSYDEPPASNIKVADASSESDGGYVKVALSDPAPLSDHSVVAIVNGEPIIAGELLAPYRSHFAAAASKGAPEAQIEQMKKEIISGQLLEQRIDQVLLVQALRLMLKSEQLKQMEEKLKEAFAEENQRIMSKLGVGSKIELEELLAKQGTSLTEYEEAFKTKQLAEMYLFTKVGEQAPVVGRHEILEYYNVNRSKYEHPARARFQLIEITKTGKPDARAKLDLALAELERGEAFPTVAQRYSQGPQADRGGQWDWLKPGEYADKQVDRALFELPVGQVSQLFESPDAYRIIKVTEREAAGRTPLAEVQEAIREQILRDAREKAVKNLFAELRENAVVTTYLQ